MLCQHVTGENVSLPSQKAHKGSVIKKKKNLFFRDKVKGVSVCQRVFDLFESLLFLWRLRLISQSHSTKKQKLKPK